MPVTKAIERNTLSLSSSAPKNYTVSSNLPVTYEEHERLSQKRSIGSSKTTNGSSKTVSTTNYSQSPRRSITNDMPGTRGRSNTDSQTISSVSIGLKQQQQTINGSSNEKLVPHQNQQQQTPTKPKCTLPSSTNQQGFVTPSKLFNMMGYGLENQYLFMHAHYLYLIDCRSREKFNENHISTAIHWEDALDGTVYISLIERFSEIVLYDEIGLSNNATNELTSVWNRYSSLNSKSCVLLSGGFEAFRRLFPFICTQSDIRSTVDREKFLTIYPSLVLDNQLYLGTGHQATNWKVVRDLKLTHIINISVEHQCVFAEKIKYLYLQFEDKEDVLVKDHFDETIRFMENALQNPTNRVLVHCNLGISRSSTLILAYLMKTYNATVLEAFKFLRHRRPIVCPNVGFLHQLIDYEYDLFSNNYSDPNDPIFH